MKQAPCRLLFFVDMLVTLTGQFIDKPCPLGFVEVGKIISDDYLFVDFERTVFGRLDDSFQPGRL